MGCLPKCRSGWACFRSPRCRPPPPNACDPAGDDARNLAKPCPALRLGQPGPQPIGEQQGRLCRSSFATLSDEHMFWLFNKTGIMTVLGALLLILAIYLIRTHMSWPAAH